MTHKLHSLKLSLIAGLSCLALTACVPGQYAYEAPSSAAETGHYSADQYGYGQYGADYGQYGASFAKTRYGNTASQGLRPSCTDQSAYMQTSYAAPCGFTTVVPVYPIYQIPVAPEPEPAPVVEIYEPPAVEVYEPEPTIIYEPAPEPVYTPMDHWPEPSTPLPSWKPIRK